MQLQESSKATLISTGKRSEVSDSSLMGFGVVSAAAFGLFAQAMFQFGWFHPSVDVMSSGFVIFMPFALGIVSVASISHRNSFRWFQVIAPPAIACVLIACVNVAFEFQPILFVVMATPLFLSLAIAGAVTWKLISRTRRLLGNYYLLFLIVPVLSPFLAGVNESRLPAAVSIRHVHTEIPIYSTRQRIWKNITRVSEIQPSEQRPSVFHALGLPRPRQAVLDHDGIGGIRLAQFTSNLIYVETVTQWDKEQDMRFSISVDRSQAPPPVIREIDGRYFTVLEGHYNIQEMPDGGFRLNLDSTERLTTRFNWYSSFWTDQIMRHLQLYILRIIKSRCEL
jgi:hypothetical protein